MVFVIHTELRFTVNHTSDLILSYIFDLEFFQHSPWTRIMYSANKQQNKTQHVRQKKRKYHSNRSKKIRLLSRSSADLNDNGTQIFKDVTSVAQNNISISEDVQYRILTNWYDKCRAFSSSSSLSSTVTSSALSFF